MKKVIKLLEGTRKGIIGFGLDLEQRMTKAEARELNRAIDQISEAIAELKAPPRWYTPEQRKERTGEEWSDMNAVYVQAYRDYQGTEDWEPQYEWGVALHYEVKGLRFTIVCATDAGKPPDNWKPEGMQ